MTSRMHRRTAAKRAFTMIELLVVIAIIAILAAILFPVFATVREQTRQSNTMSNMHAVYLGARLYNEDEGHYPTTLFGYAAAVLQSGNQNPNGDPNKTNFRPAVLGDTGATMPFLAQMPGSGQLPNIVPMDRAVEDFSTGKGLNTGYLYGEQIKDISTFSCTDRLISNKQAVTEVYWPRNTPIANGGLVKVAWTQGAPGTCSLSGDRDFPSNAEQTYADVPKLFYTMDSMDIGPMLDANGNVMKDGTGAVMYELHYSPDWSHELYDAINGCDVAQDTDTGQTVTLTTQLKYKNPPTERTILTYNTDHAATAGSPSVIILLNTGTARKIKYDQAFKQLPLYYK